MWQEAARLVPDFDVSKTADSIVCRPNFPVWMFITGYAPQERLLCVRDERKEEHTVKANPSPGWRKVRLIQSFLYSAV